MKEQTKLNKLIEITKHTNDFFNFCDDEGMYLCDDWFNIIIYLDTWKNKENIDQKIVDKVWNYIIKNVTLELDLYRLYSYYDGNDMPDEAEFRKLWQLNKRQYNIVMKYFAEEDLESKKEEMNKRINKMNTDFK